MKKTLVLTLIVLVIVFVLGSCDANNPEETTKTPEQPVHIHNYEEWKIIKNPTCEDDGMKVRYCSCGEKQSEAIASLGHTPGEVVIENKIEATCEANGSYDEVVYCDVEICKLQIGRITKTISALNHNYVDRVCTLCGDALPSEGLEFTSNGDGTCYVNGIGTCTDTDIVIPSTSPDGDIVTGVGERAFDCCFLLENIAIPDSVTYIGKSAFRSCESLTRITIPGSVTSIGDGAFYHCSSLASITIPASVGSIGINAFGSCESLTDVYYTGNIETWLDISFKVLSSTPMAYATNFYIHGELITNVTIPNTVTNISNYAFYNFTSLRSVIIPDSVIDIGDYVFYNCISLQNVEIPNLAFCNKEQTFYNCESLASINFGGRINEFRAFPHMYNWDENTGDYVIYCIDGEVTKNYKATYYDTDSTGLAFVINSDGESYSVTSIGVCTDTAIVIPKTYNGLPVTGIADYAFYNVNSFENIIIPDSVTSIGNYAFYNCYSKFNSITIPNSVTSIGKYAFSDCDKLTSVIIPDSVKSIGDGAFSFCDNLASVVIGNELNTISENMFAYSSSLITVIIPDSVIIIKDSAFYTGADLMKVYYTSNEEEWTKISINSNNSYITNATIYYYSETTPTTEGNFWHYVDGVPTVWAK